MGIKTIYVAILGLLVILIPVVHAEEFKSSLSCIDCHQDRYQEWSRSMHALAISDPIFEAEYLMAIRSDPQYRSYCLTCHAPTTVITKDLNLTKSVSVEGVTCSFCHTVTEVKGNEYIFNQTNPMQGPYTDSKTDAHASEYSELLTKSEFCAGCHEFSINGVPISETYSEWKEGPYAAEGKQCQDCHMEAKQGVAAKNGKIREKVYQHFWYGGHTGLFLENAIKVESNIELTGNVAKVVLNITNIRVGHKVPSGLPSRKVVLSFKANDERGQEIFSEQRVYAKTIVDQYGNEVENFWKASSIAMDNRIKPGESRMEFFEFKVPEGTNRLNTKATLTYQLESQILQTVSMNIDVAEMSRTVSLNMTPAETTPREMPDVGWSGSIVVFFLVYIFAKRKIK